MELYAALFSHYGDPHWWPAKTPYEVIVGAVLTQNTAWANVEKAIAGFGDKLTPQVIADMPLTRLRDVIKPAGSFVRKASTLKAVTAWYAGYGWEVAAVQRQPLQALRVELLAIHGIGPETADAMLLYAFGFPTFVVDAYTLRLCGRYPLAEGGYQAVKAYFERNLPRDATLYNALHALIVLNGKAHCRKRPVCGGCPLAEGCKKRMG